jgi:hypothetical protein
MEFKFGDIENAYLYVNSGPDFRTHAILCKDRENIYYASDFDVENEITEEVYTNDECIEIPSKCQGQ